jgi:hypothetical protein
MVDNISHPRPRRNLDNPKGFNEATLRLIEALGGDPRTGKCLCPCHDDGHNPSLSVSSGTKVLTVVHCFGVGTKEHDLEVIAHLKQQGWWPTNNKLLPEQRAAAANIRSPKERRQFALKIWNDLGRINRKRQWIDFADGLSGQSRDRTSAQSVTGTTDRL